jgi:cobalamin 5'-phosphate synthase/cobalamin synthase
MKQIIQGFILSLTLLSTLPFLHVHTFFKGINGYAAMFYPLVGFILGAILLLLSWLLTGVFEPTHSALIILACWVGLTGALHLDGLSDTIDALFVSKERRRAVLKDPHIGAMGVHFSLIFLLLKASALWHLHSLYLLPLIMMLARYNITVALRYFTYNSEGMATLAKQELTAKQFFFSSCFVMAIALFYPQGVMLFAIALLYLWLISRWLIQKFGTLHGDGYGFIIETTELLLLHILLLGAML